MHDDDAPKHKGVLADLIAQDLSPMGVEELQDRIALLKAEIVRTEDALSSRDSSRAAAEAVFGS